MIHPDSRSLTWIEQVAQEIYPKIKHNYLKCDILIKPNFWGALQKYIDYLIRQYLTQSHSPPPIGVVVRAFCLNFLR